MKVRDLSKFFMSFLAMCAIVACSDNELDGNKTNPDPDPGTSKSMVYMNVTVQLPVGAGTRSTTGDTGGSSDGTEEGLERENAVKSVLLVLADKDNKFIGCAEKSESLTKGTNGKITTIQSISRDVLREYYGDNPETELAAGKENVNVFVFCNPTVSLRDELKAVSFEDDKWYDKYCSISEEPGKMGDNVAIWGGPDHKGGFLMSSATVAQKTFPKKLSDWDRFTTMETAFDLSGTNQMGDVPDTEKDIKNDGAIKVERSVARFDFKDGSPKAGGKANTYAVVKDPADDTKYIVNIELKKMALVNMSKNFYYLRRVSNDGLGKSETDNGWALCGTETSANYVVDTDAADKNTEGGIADYTTNFNFCLGNKDNGWAIDVVAREQWYTSKISDVLAGTADHPDWQPTTDYKIWRYVTENTIPGDIKNQKNGVTTGIVFKGKMIPVGTDENNSLYKALKEAKGKPDVDPILYVYGTNIYVSWKEVRAAAIAAGPGDPLYRAAFGADVSTEENEKPVAEELEADGETIKTPARYSDDVTSADYFWNKWYNDPDITAGTEEKDPVKLADFKEAATSNQFTLYQSSTDEGDPGYYCYYYYWNRHNDNGRPGIMGKMEFAVVRNNVYKLAVTNITRLGHPRLSENDPDPVKPEDPDEESNVYLTVSVEVLPWVVRVNNIDF